MQIEEAYYTLLSRLRAECCEYLTHVQVENYAVDRINFMTNHELMEALCEPFSVESGALQKSLTRYEKNIF